MNFIFEKHPKQKGTCPKCQKTKAFRFYEGLPRKYGICDRINECGHFEDPHQEPKEIQKELRTGEIKAAPEPKQEIIYPTKPQLQKWVNNQGSSFHVYLQSLITDPKHFKRWGVGTDFHGNTVFVIANKKQALNLKTIKYQDNGKRDKKQFPFYLKAPEGKKYSRCLYGEHLLSEDQTICLVESEKTAVLAAFFYPQFDWLATGGNNGISKEMIPALFNRKIYYLCDADKAGRESTTIKRLQEYKQDYHVIDLFPKRDDGYDLADYLLNDYPKNKELLEIKEPVKEEPKEPKAPPNSIWEMVEEFISERYEIHANVVSNKIQFRPVDEPDEPFTELNENDVYRELAINHIRFSLGNLKAMLGSTFVPKYNPIQEYFNKLKPYDPKTEPDYIDALQSYLPVDESDREFLKIQFKKMFVRSIACSVYGTVNKQAFILVHNQQNSGKTTFLRWLCPPELKDYFAENIQTDKDSLIAMCTNFVINMDELATLSRMEVNALKSVMSKDVFKGRLPYAARETKLVRRANIVGSTNNSQFLSDETGSVRWLCFELTDKLNFDYNKDIDINRVWAQAYYMYHDKFFYELTLKEIEENERRNKKHTIQTLEHELIQKFFYPPGKANYILDIMPEDNKFFKSAAEIKLILAERAPSERTSEIKIGKALHALGYKRTSMRSANHEYPRYGYYIEPIPKVDL